MKKLLTVLALTLLSFGAYCQQNVKVDSQGNYHALTQSTESKAVNTGKTFTDSKGIKYPVMRSVKGKLFIIRTSKKTGNKYNYYLKIN